MTIVDCPVCCSGVALPDDAEALECPTCEVSIEIADAPDGGTMPAAA